MSDWFIGLDVWVTEKRHGTNCSWVIAMRWEWVCLGEWAMKEGHVLCERNRQQWVLIGWFWFMSWERDHSTKLIYPMLFIYQSSSFPHKHSYSISSTLINTSFPTTFFECWTSQWVFFSTYLSFFSI